MEGFPAKEQRDSGVERKRVMFRTPTGGVISAVEAGGFYSDVQVFLNGQTYFDHLRSQGMGASMKSEADFQRMRDELPEMPSDMMDKMR